MPQNPAPQARQNAQNLLGDCRVQALLDTLVYSEARDFYYGGNSGAPTGAYRRSYQYSPYNQITQQTNRLWSQTQTVNNSFVNNRLQGWSYDAAGGLTNDGTNNYTRDAASRLVQSGMNGSYSVNKFDGDGRLVRTSILNNNTESLVTYYLNSSVLGLAVSKLDSNGQRQESYVYAGGKKITTASPWQAGWTHEDPVTGSHGISIVAGLYGADAEFSADGVDVGFAEPTSPAPERWVRRPFLVNDINDDYISKDLAVIVVDTTRTNPERFGLVIFNAPADNDEESVPQPHWVYRERDLSTTFLGYSRDGLDVTSYKEDGTFTLCHVKWNKTKQEYDCK